MRVIRDAIDSDAAALADIYNYYVRNTAITFEEVPLTASEMSQRVAGILAAGYVWLVAVDNQRVVGYACSSPWKPRAAYRHTVEISVYVAHDAVSTGWGTRLYQAIFLRLRESAVHIAIGGIALPNTTSVALHEKFGMEKVAHFKEVGFKHGAWIDVGYWQVQLQA